MRIPKNIEKWLKALRSGKYKQGTGVLCRKTGRTKEYCCLGVYVEANYPEISANKELDPDYGTMAYHLPSGPSRIYLQSETAKELHPSHEKFTSDVFQRDLGALNDKRIPFSNIADHIEKTWKEWKNEKAT